MPFVEPEQFADLGVVPLKVFHQQRDLLQLR